MRLVFAKYLAPLVATAWLGATMAPAAELQRNEVVKETLGIIYSGDETLHYEVSWSGGVKIGDIHMQIRAQQPPEIGHVITAHVKDAIEQVDGKGLILGPGCVVNPKASEENLRALRKATEL